MIVLDGILVFGLLGYLQLPVLEFVGLKSADALVLLGLVSLWFRLCWCCVVLEVA